MNGTTPGAASGTDLCRHTSNFYIGNCASSIRYKDSVEDLSTERALSILDTLQSRTFRVKDDGTFMIGFIAEEAYNADPRLVYFNELGQIEGLRRDGFTSALVKGYQYQKNRIDDTIVDVSYLQASKLDMTGGTINGTLNIIGGLNTTGEVIFDNLTVNGDSIFNGKVIVNGNIEAQSITVNGHIITAGDTPSSIAGTAAGTDAITEVLGNDTSGTLTITTGTNVANGTLIEVNFAKAFVKNPKVMLTPSDANSADLRYFGDGLTDKFKINLTQAPAASTTYKFNYFIVE
jgi:hypothetical protein